MPDFDNPRARARAEAERILAEMGAGESDFDRYQQPGTSADRLMRRMDKIPEQMIHRSMQREDMARRGMSDHRPEAESRREDKLYWKPSELRRYFRMGQLGAGERLGDPRSAGRALSAPPDRTPPILRRGPPLPERRQAPEPRFWRHDEQAGGPQEGAGYLLDDPRFGTRQPMAARTRGDGTQGLSRPRSAAEQRERERAYQQWLALEQGR